VKEKPGGVGVSQVRAATEGHQEDDAKNVPAAAVNFVSDPSSSSSSSRIAPSLSPDISMVNVGGGRRAGYVKLGFGSVRLPHRRPSLLEWTFRSCYSSGQSASARGVATTWRHIDDVQPSPVPLT
jgi:hypothetical protein